MVSARGEHAAAQVPAAARRGDAAALAECPAVELCGAGFSYAAGEGSVDSLRDVCLSIRRGECVVVTGPSGCGKTTLSRMVNGLIPAVYAGEQAGEARVLGSSIAQWEMDDLSCAVGSVFQNPRSQFFNLDTTSEIAFGCENMGVERAEIGRRIAQTVETLGIDHLLERDIRALSGGEKQLVAVASVYAMGPDVFVFDEPTAALDVAAMQRLGAVVARLKAAGKTVVVAEHRLWWLAGVADRIVIMGDGRVRADMSASSFAALPPCEREKLGLRAWDICEVVPNRRDPGASCAPPPSEASKEAGVSGAPEGPALSVRGLRVCYGRRAGLVIDGLDFDAYAGRAVAIVGRNGVGKTTFARCLAGLHAEAAGEVVVGDVALSARTRAGRVYLAMQESGYQLFSDTVEGELRLALEACARCAPVSGGTAHSTADASAGADPDAGAAADVLVEEKLRDLGLSDVRDRHPLSLSGGQRQRLAIAAGALQGARVTVLDEPTSGLDLANMRRVAAEIDRLKADGVCIVVITHDFEFACATCDEIAHLDGGRIVERFPLTAGTAPRARALFGFDQPSAAETGVAANA